LQSLPLKFGGNAKPGKMKSTALLTTFQLPPTFFTLQSCAVREQFLSILLSGFSTVDTRLSAMNEYTCDQTRKLLSIANSYHNI